MKEIIIPIRNLLPIEDPRFFGEEKIPEILDIITLTGPLPIVTAIPYQKKAILPDGHTRTLANAIRGMETQKVRLIENEEDRIKYGRGALMSELSLEEFIDDYRRNIKEDMKKANISCVHDYPLMKFRNYILQITRVRQK